MLNPPQSYKSRVCESALLSAVTCLAKGESVINLTCPVPLHFVSIPLCILVKGPTETYTGL